MNKLNKIKRLLKLGVPKSVIAKQFNVSRQAIYDYLKKRYKPKTS